VTSVHVSLIDGFELRCDGEVVRLPLGSQRLVAYLALRNRPLMRLHVAGRLWAETSEARSFASLRTALWRIPGLAAGVVEATSSHVGLGREVVVDVREMIGLARGLLEQPEDLDEADIESSKLAGDLLPDWYDDWVLIERERLRQLRVHALETLAERLTRQGQFGRAIDTALTAIAADPLRESAHRVLIKAYVAEGNGGAGIRHYQEYCRRLREELGLGPSPQLQAIVDELSG
jgi:DNA-binding SARP family transcriptional activator